MNANINLIASIGLAIGALFGMSGLAFTSPVAQLCLFVISGVGFTVGLTLLVVKFLWEKDEFLATGFLLFAMGETISTLNAAADEQTAASSFAGCMLFYVTGFLFICLRPTFPLWTRITGLLSATIFLAAAIRFYLGYGISTADTLPGIGYGLLTLTLIGWITYLLRERSESFKTSAIIT
jgi:hypothetical protein